MKIIPAAKGDYPAFKRLFCDYYRELDCEDAPLPLLADCVLPDYTANLLNIALCFDGDDICGFAIFQIDDVINDWCFKDGWGTVRELYVLPEKRRKGYGSALAEYCEKELKKEPINGIYALPTEEAEKFFLSRGYADSGEYCPELDNKVFTKRT